jgi:hypothetical protein
MNEEIIKALPTEALIKIKDVISSEIKLRNRRLKVSSKPKDYIEEVLANRDIQKHNSGGLYSVRNIKSTPSAKQPYYSALIEQDWSLLYPRESNCGRFYVYAHVDPSQPRFEAKPGLGGDFCGRPFYIGKGCDERAFNLKRNQGHGKKLKQLLTDGWDASDIVHIIFDGLDEQKAYELEAKLIYFFGSIYQKGRKKAFLYNLDLPKVPEFKGEMKKHLNKRELAILNSKEQI